tara:strand:+ start:168 stop:983 length:816 start_codon:yes stop_codon:yes gene_type:complete
MQGLPITKEAFEVLLRIMEKSVQTVYRFEPVYQRIFRSIVTGAMVPGTRLPPEVELARQYGVSRPVLRQALEELKREGLIVSRRGAGNFITEFRPSEFSQIDIQRQIKRCLTLYEFRLGIEPAIAALAASNISEESVSQLEVVLDEDANQLRSGLRTGQEDSNFHFLIASASGNVHYENTIRLVQDEIAFNTFSIRSMMGVGQRADASGDDYLRTIPEEHYRIFQAVKSGRSEDAQEQMRLHLENGRNFLVEFHLSLLKAASAPMAAPQRR